MSLLARVRARLEHDPRLSRVLHGGASSLLSRIISIGVSAVSLPFTVRYLGKQEYGVWVTIATSVVMFNVLDLGIANTLTNVISEAYAEDDREKARHAYATAFWLTVGVAALLGLLAAAVFPLIDFASLLHLSNALEARHARAAIAIAIGYFVLGLPLNLADRVLGGYQQLQVANYFSIVTSLLGLVTLLAVIHVRGNIALLMFALCLATLTGQLAKQVWLSVFSRPWLKPWPQHARLPIARKLFGQGAFFFVLQLANLIVFNSDNLVITHYLGPAEVTPYSVAWRLTNYAAMLQAIMVPALWPAFAEAYHKRDMRWVRGTYWSMVRKTMLVVAAAALVIGLLGRWFIALWAGPAAVPSLVLLWTMAGWAVLVSYTTNQSILLTATGRLRLEATVAALAAVVNLWLSIVLVRRIGSEGVILATVLSFLVLMLVPQELEVASVLKGRFLPAELDSIERIEEHSPAEATF